MLFLEIFKICLLAKKWDSSDFFNSVGDIHQGYYQTQQRNCYSQNVFYEKH